MTYKFMYMWSCFRLYAMNLEDFLRGYSTILLALLLLVVPLPAHAYGAMGPIAAAYGSAGFFCAIEASERQEIVCWIRNESSPSAAAADFSSVPPMAALSGGDGFMCGLRADSSLPYCWNSKSPGTNLVPPPFQNTAYSSIAAGAGHVCAVRGSYYLGGSYSGVGSVDCWGFSKSASNLNSGSAGFRRFDLPAENRNFETVVSGNGFTCGEVQGSRLSCWGPNSSRLAVASASDGFAALASGGNSVCGILRHSGEVRCWGEDNAFGPFPMKGIRFVGLAAGLRHVCGIREDSHGIECWGSINASSIPKGSGFLVIASSEFTTCGVREDDLILDCWGGYGLPATAEYMPPLQLCSPGVCTSNRCGHSEFSFNASILNVPDLSTLCVRKDLRICSPCGTNCSEGFFASSVCGENMNRVCTACSLCQNSTCWDACGLSSTGSMGEKQHRGWLIKLAVIIGASVFGCLALVLLGWCFVPRMKTDRKNGDTAGRSQCVLCVGKVETEADNNPDLEQPCIAPDVPTLEFRLSELKDATNGFKELNELGRGSSGIVYKAVLSDGRQVAVKRANAVTRIHSNSRDFEAELEILCKIRHCNLVNLLGYCAEMGERLLVYEFMCHGTLHDHLHGGLPPLNWGLRLKISMQAAHGLDFLHKDAVPPIIHRDVKTSNILLDADWGARVADFGLSTTADRTLHGDLVYVDPDYQKTQTFTEKSDAYSFGIVLLEILSGRKAYDEDYTPPSIVEWAVPLIRKGKAAAIIDRNVNLPRNVEPLLKLAEIAEFLVKEDPQERPLMSDVASWLDQIVKGGCFS